MDVYKRVSDILQQAQKEEAKARARSLRRCDWEDPDDVREYRSDVRREARLAALPATRKCPLCELIVLSSRSWVVARDLSSAMCRSCFFRQHGSNKVTITMDASLFEIEQRFRVNPVTFSAAVRKTGLSSREFARRVGWSPSYQRKLESGGQETITKEAAEMILQTLSEAGVVTRDLLL